MTGPTRIPAAGPLVPDDVASVIGPALMRNLAEAQRNGSTVHADVAETIGHLDLEAPLGATDETPKKHGIFRTFTRHVPCRHDGSQWQAQPKHSKSPNRPLSGCSAAGRSMESRSTGCGASARSP